MDTQAFTTLEIYGIDVCVVASMENEKRKNKPAAQQELQQSAKRTLHGRGQDMIRNKERDQLASVSEFIQFKEEVSDCYSMLLGY